MFSRRLRTETKTGACLIVYSFSILLETDMQGILNVSFTNVGVTGPLKGRHLSAMIQSGTVRSTAERCPRTVSVKIKLRHSEPHKVLCAYLLFTARGDRRRQTDTGTCKADFIMHMGRRRAAWSARPQLNHNLYFGWAGLRHRQRPAFASCTVGIVHCIVSTSISLSTDIL
ncbi:hypothetical protein BJX63DRAFT_59123 [Aspergillus granulosus]|uniref:Uncharacterized protein n=1 Tax=Aspergillus granulosus TaxID=176169 RepID=A0ABR4HTG5_9EURO